MAISAAATKLLKWLRLYNIDAATLNTRRATPSSQPNKSYLNNVANKSPRIATTYKGTMSTSMTALLAAIPTISSFTPTSAAGASSGGVQEVVITGTRLTGATSVKFGGVEAASFVVNNATTITAQVAAGSLSGSVSVVTPDGDASKTGFTFLKRPTISSFTTPVATGGSVIILGKNFTGTTGASSVTFNSINAASYTVNYDHQITAVVPAGLTSGSIVVTNTGGTATKAGFVHTPIVVGVPTSFTATAASATQIDLAWVAPAGGATNYILERSANGTSGWAQIYSNTTASYSNTGLTTATQYFYRVKAQRTGETDSTYATANATTS